MIEDLKKQKQKAAKNGQDISVYVNKYGNFQCEFPKVNILL